MEASEFVLKAQVRFRINKHAWTKTTYKMAKNRKESTQILTNSQGNIYSKYIYIYIYCNIKVQLPILVIPQQEQHINNKC